MNWPLPFEQQTIPNRMGLIQKGCEHGLQIHLPPGGIVQLILRLVKVKRVMFGLPYCRPYGTCEGKKGHVRATILSSLRD